MRFGIETSEGVFTESDAVETGRSPVSPEFSFLAGTVVRTLDLNRMLRLRYAESALSGEQGLVVSVGIENISGKPIALHDVSPVLLDKGGLPLELKGNWSLYKHGKHKSELATAYFPGKDTVTKADLFEDKYEPGGKVVREGQEYFDSYSSGFAELCDEKGRHCLVGALTCKNQFVDVRMTLEGESEALVSLEAICHFDGISLQPGESVQTERILTLFTDTPFAAIDRYSELTAYLNGARTAQPKSGWCSWYFYYGQDTEDDIKENVAWFKANRYPIDVILIDGGWQRHIGELQPNEKYRSGMRGLADHIRQNGFTPGIWTAPFAVSPDSGLAKQHPDWLLKKKDGGLVVHNMEGKGCYQLDPSIEAVRRHLVNTYGMLTKEMGYEYLKIDFLMDLCYDRDIRYTGNVTRAQALRLGLESVREGAGRQVYIAACGGMYGPDIGIVDANRSSSDTLACYFDPERPNGCSYKRSAKLNINRFFMHQNFWINDPDCIMARRRTEPFRGIDRSISELTDAEVRHQLTLCWLTGGLMIISDRMRDYDEPQNQDRERLLRACFPINPDKGVPLDLYRSSTPEIVVSEIRFGHAQGGYNVGVFNWEDSERRMVFSLADLRAVGSECEAFHVFDFYHQEYLGVKRVDETLEAVIGPHDCALYGLRPFVAEKACIVGSSLNLGMGAYEVSLFCIEEAQVKVRLTAAASINGDVFFYLPPESHVDVRPIRQCGKNVYVMKSNERERKDTNVE